MPQPARDGAVAAAPDGRQKPPSPEALARQHRPHENWESHPAEVHIPPEAKSEVATHADPDLEEAQGIVDTLLKEDEHLVHDAALNKKAKDLTAFQRRRLKTVLESIRSKTDLAAASYSAAQLELFCGELLTSSAGAAEKRKWWFWIERVGDGLTAVGSAAGGSALIAHLKGTAGTIVGIAVLVVGVLGAAFHALGGEQQYQRNRAKRRAYDALWWSAWNYALYQLPADNQAQRRTAIENFRERWREIGTP